MKKRLHPLLHCFVAVSGIALFTLTACGQAESAPNTPVPENGAGQTAPAELHPPLPLGEANDAVRELESALGMLKSAPQKPGDGPLMVADPHGAESTEPAPAPARTPPEPIFDGLPPEDTLPADIPSAAVRLWSESSPDDEPVMMTDSTHREVALLRRDIQRLNNNLESLLHHYVGALHEENERLRQEIERLYVMQLQDGRQYSAVPRPNAGVLDAITGDLVVGALPPMDLPGPGRITMEPIPLEVLGVQTSPPVPTLEAGPGVMALDTHGDTQFAVIEEWGRTPDEARSFGEGVTSLKGLILAVPAGLTKGSLEGLAHHLRSEYDAFDNINVKIFEGVEAAQRYAQSNEVTPGALVVDITKHAASQRDIILLTQGGEVTVLPGPEGATAPSAPAASARPNAGLFREALVPRESPQLDSQPGEPSPAAPEEAPAGLHRDALVPRERPGSAAAETPQETPQETPRDQTFSIEALLEQTRAASAAANSNADRTEAPVERENAEDAPVPIFVPADQYDAGNAP